eukprot:g19754.t1
MSKVAALSFALAIDAGHGFVVPARTNGQASAAAASQTAAATATSPAPAMGDATIYGTAMMATAAAGVLARGKRSKVTRKALHGIKFPYSLQKDSHADLEFLNDTSTTLRKPAGFLYSVQKDAYVDLTFGNDVGYLPDGTPMNLAGNCMNHPENIGPDPHAPGSPLPRALFVNDVGYLPDGTPMNAAGNAINHPETMGPDPHSPGSPLPPSAYAADIGYLVDGTPLDKAGNNAVH